MLTHIRTHRPLTALARAHKHMHRTHTRARTLTCTRVHIAALTHARRMPTHSVPTHRVPTHSMPTHRMPMTHRHTQAPAGHPQCDGQWGEGAHCASSSSWSDPGARSLCGQGRKGDPSRAENPLSERHIFGFPCLCVPLHTPGGSYRRSWLSPRTAEITLPAFLSNQTEPDS